MTRYVCRNSCDRVKSEKDVQMTLKIVVHLLNLSTNISKRFLVNIDKIRIDINIQELN